MMSGEFETWLKTLKMRFQRRKIFLFLNKATSHADITINNIKLQFFPSNTQHQSCSPCT